MALYDDNDMRVRVTGLQDADDNTITGATVEATLYESDETTEVGGVTWPLTLTDQGGGTYQGRLPDTAETVVGNDYYLVVEAAGDGLTGKWTSHEVCTRRGFDA